LTEFLVALAAFLLLHIVPALPGIRARLIGAVGRGVYLAAYSTVSLVLLAWMIHAALKLEFTPLWSSASWQAWFTLILTPIGLFLLLAGLMSANPASISMARDGSPGAITAITRHPVLWGFVFWSASHIVPNGDLRSLLLFGILLLFALLGIPMSERRARKRLGADWPNLSRTTSVVPFVAIAGGRTRLRVDRPMGLALLITAAVTAWLLTGGHVMLFGADPLALAGW